LEIQALRLGPAALLGIPAEVFAQIGLDVEGGSPFPLTAVVELANGWEGYLPTREAFAEGGYETLLARSRRSRPPGQGVAANPGRARYEPAPYSTAAFPGSASVVANLSQRDTPDDD
jgi:hypothetical protein